MTVPAYAQSTTPQSGPYKVSISIHRGALTVRTLAIEITVADPAGQPVSDAAVRVLVKRASDEGQGWAHALTTPQTPGRYEAEVQLEEPGTWDVAVEVKGPLGEMLINEPPVVITEDERSTTGAVLFGVVLAALVLGTGYLVWSSRRALRARANNS